MNLLEEVYSIQSWPVKQIFSGAGNSLQAVTLQVQSAVERVILEVAELLHYASLNQNQSQNCKDTIEAFKDVKIFEFCDSEAEARRSNEDNKFKKAKQLNKLLGKVRIAFEEQFGTQNYTMNTAKLQLLAKVVQFKTDKVALVPTKP